MTPRLQAGLTHLDQLRAALGDYIDEGSSDDLLALLEETDIKEAAAAVVDSIEEDEGLLAGLELRADALETRSIRLKRSIAARRNLLLMVMSRCNQDKLKLSTCTVSKVTRPACVEITDELALPAEFWKRPDPVPDKVKIASALKAEKDVPGARFGEPGLGIQIRR